jgi:uncharacterized membrane protein
METKITKSTNGDMDMMSATTVYDGDVEETPNTALTVISTTFICAVHWIIAACLLYLNPPSFGNDAWIAFHVLAGIGGIGGAIGVCLVSRSFGLLVKERFPVDSISVVQLWLSSCIMSLTGAVSRDLGS